PTAAQQSCRRARQARDATPGHATRSFFRGTRRNRVAPVQAEPTSGEAGMTTTMIAIAGAAETELGALPHMSELDLRADAAHRALADAGLTLADIDGVTSAVESPIDVAHYLGI